MLITVLTPEGPDLVDASTLSPEAQAMLGVDLSLRAEQLLANSPPMMTMPDVQELLRILCQWTGLTPPPTP